MSLGYAQRCKHNPTCRHVVPHRSTCMHAISTLAARNHRRLALPRCSRHDRGRGPDRLRGCLPGVPTVRGAVLLSPTCSLSSRIMFLICGRQTGVNGVVPHCSTGKRRYLHHLGTERSQACLHNRRHGVKRRHTGWRRRRGVQAVSRRVGITNVRSHGGVAAELAAACNTHGCQLHTPKTPRQRTPLLQAALTW
mgnify:CR=1 FL=1